MRSADAISRASSWPSEGSDRARVRSVLDDSGDDGLGGGATVYTARRMRAGAETLASLAPSLPKDGPTSASRSKRA